MQLAHQGTALSGALQRHFGDSNKWEDLYCQRHTGIAVQPATDRDIIAGEIFPNRQYQTPGLPPRITQSAIASHQTAAPTAVDKSKKGQAERVRAKLQDPAGQNQTMSVPDTQIALGRSRSTVYRLLAEGRLKWAKLTGRVRTDSVIDLLQERN